MNFIVSGDQHIKISKDLPLEWQVNRYRQLWLSYIDLCKQYKATLILTGDMFHNVKPSLHEGMLFMELCQKLEEQRISSYIIAGNHENMGAAGTTLDYYRPMINTLRYVIYHAYENFPVVKKGECSLLFVGHNQLQKWLDTGPTKWDGTRIIFSHFRPTISQFIQEEIDVKKFMSTCDYCFAGDIHSSITLFDGKLVFTNAPLNNHFEPKPDTGCLLVSINGDAVDWRRIPLKLPNLIQKTATAAEFEDLVDLVNYTRIEVTGTPEELRQIKTSSGNTKLLKVPVAVETYTEAADEVAVKERPLDEELVDYMKSLHMPELEIKSMMEVFYGP